MDLYDIAIARKLSGGGGGGGSSDFSKAIVNVIGNDKTIDFLPNTLESDAVIAVCVVDWGLTASEDDMHFNVDNTLTETFYILNNNYITAVSYDAPTQNYSVTGNAEVSSYSGTNIVKIYGDCTITIS